MNYLCFDFECCDGHHICEFGFVLFDENFKILKTDCITINPEEKFNLPHGKNVKSVDLAFSYKQYYKSPNFPKVYKYIKQIITTPNQQIIGFSLKNDVAFLKTACEKYNMQTYEFSYLDFQDLYCGYAEIDHCSVATFVQDLEIKDITLHKSVDDSLAIMYGLKSIAKKENLSLPNTIDYLIKKRLEYTKKQEKIKREEFVKKILEGDEKAQNKYIKTFLSKQNIISKGAPRFLKGKKVNVAFNYQKGHLSELINLISIIFNNGGMYTVTPSSCDIFVNYKLGPEDDIRLTSVKYLKENNNQKIKIMSFRGFLSLLNIDEDNLKKPNNNPTLDEK